MRRDSQREGEPTNILKTGYKINTSTGVYLISEVRVGSRFEKRFCSRYICSLGTDEES